jgi:hypothetical protein
VIPQAGKKPLLRERFVRGRVKSVQLHVSEWRGASSPAQPLRDNCNLEAGAQS